MVARARAQLKLDAVERGMRKPRRRSFGDLLDEFETVALKAKPREATTVVEYKATIRNHLRPWFGDSDLAKLSRSPEAWERYAAGIEDGGSRRSR